VQNTLLGIAIALILALVAALVGPIFVDWNSQRGFFEAEAKRLVGLPVHVTGAIDARLLPTPSITLRGITIGEQGDASRLRAGALSFQLGLGPLMRGEIKAVEMRLVGPEVAVGLKRDGSLDVPNVTIGLKGETLSIERLSVEEGRLILTDETSGSRIIVDKLVFRGEARSLIGPIRGEGTFVVGEGQHAYRVSTGRFVDDAAKVKLTIDLGDRPLTIEADGTLGFDAGTPRFEGSLSAARPVGAVLASGKATINEPWRASTKIKAQPASVLFDQVEFQYGPEDRAMKLTGTAEVKFGEQPRLQGLFSGRHMDLDRLVAKPDMNRQMPFAAVKTFAEMFGDVLKPTIPTRLAISVDSVTLGGAMLQLVISDLSSDGDVWNLDKLEFRAPGFTQVRANGRLELTAKGLGFAGLANVNSADSMTLLGWLTGHGNPKPGPLKPWHAYGLVTLTNDRIAVDQLRTEFDRATLEGRIAYAASSSDRPAQLKAELNATELDVDAWLQVADKMFAGLALERPRELDLSLTVDKTRIADLELRKAAVVLKLDKNGLDLKRLMVDGFGNTTMEASGRIDMQSASPRGNISVNLDSPDLTGVVALSEKYAPSISEPLRRLTAAQPSAKLRASIGVESSSAGAATRRTTAKFGVDGQIGVFKISMAGATAASGEHVSLADLSALANGDLRFEGQVDTDDGAALLVLIGFDRVASSEKRPGRMRLVASGPLGRDFRIDGRLTAGPIDLNGVGTGRLPGEHAAIANFTQLYGTIGGNKVQGKAMLTFGAPLRIDGAVETERIDVPAALASIIGVSAERLKTGESWSLEPFPKDVSSLSGRVEVKATRAVLSARHTAQALRGALQFSASKVSLEIFESELAGGRLTGDVAFFNSPEGLSALSYLELTGAKAAEVIPSDGRPPITGKISLKATIEGAGLTPAAFVGSLHGNGDVVIERGEFAGLNPTVFDALTRAVDLGIPADTKQIKEFVVTLLDKGSLAVTRAQSKIAVVGGQARLIEPQVQMKGAELAVAAAVDLANATVDATLTLSGAPEGDVAGRPAVAVTLKGAFTAPRVTINSDSLAGWLALRSVERQSKRLETIEAARRAASAPPLSDMFIPSFTPMASSWAAMPPVARPAEEEETNQAPAQTTNDASTLPTGGIVGANQVPPPLPPAIVVEPASKPLDRSGVRRRGANAPLP
jgi:large subunit ribosomal protein L24